MDGILLKEATQGMKKMKPPYTEKPLQYLKIRVFFFDVPYFYVYFVP